MEPRCRLCGREGAAEYLDTSHNFINHNSILVSLAEVINKILIFDAKNTQICKLCKEKLVEFYHFKMRAEQVKLLETDVFNADQEVSDPAEDDKSMFTVIQIVKDFLKRNTITEIKEDVDEQQRMLIIVSKYPVNQNRQEFSEFESVNAEGIFREDSIEYLEDCLADEDVVEAPCKEDISLDEEVFDETEEIIYEYNSDASQKQNSESASESQKQNNPRRGRQRRPDTWACNKRKTLRNRGLQYLNSKGKLVAAKQMRESCGDWCRSKCAARISEQDRKDAFDNYWALGDVVKQRKFIFEHITSATPKRRRSSSETSSRSITLQFYLDARSDDDSYESVQVCKRMFKNTLVISSQVIQGVVKKYSLEGFNDARGKFKRKLSVAQQIATEHVKKFPFFYIEQNMTKVQCYSLYCQECNEQGIEPVKEGNYRDIFDRQNQGNFLKTQRVTCEICHRFYQATDEQRAPLQKEHDDHISLGINKKCRDRALGRLRHKRAQERKKLQRMAENISN